MNRQRSNCKLNRIYIRECILTAGHLVHNLCRAFRHRKVSAFGTEPWRKVKIGFLLLLYEMKNLKSHFI